MAVGATDPDRLTLQHRNGELTDDALHEGSTLKDRVIEI